MPNVMVFNAIFVQEPPCFNSLALSSEISRAVEQAMQEREVGGPRAQTTEINS